MSIYGVLGIIGALVFFSTMGYLFLMVFYPEWVGMSGEDTQKTLQAHQKEDEASSKD